MGEWAACALALSICAGEALAWHPVLVGKACGAVFVASSLALLVVGRVRPVLPRVLGWWGLLFLLCTLSLLWTADPDATGRAVRHLSMEGVLLFALLQWPRPEVLLRRIAQGAGAGALCLGAGLLWMFVSGEERGMRIVVGEGDPNLQARQIGLGLILGLRVLQDYEGRARQRVLWSVLVVAACALGITGSRGATVAVLAGLGVWGWARPNRAAASVLGLLVILSLGATELRGDLRSPLGSVLSGEREDMASGRDAIWANTLDLLGQDPFLGVGVAAVPAAYDAARDRRMASGGMHSKRGRDPHSLYLQLLVGLGPLGLFLFLMAGGTLLRQARGHPQRSAALAVLVFLALSATTQSTLELKDFWLGFAWVALLLRE